MALQAQDIVREAYNAGTEFDWLAFINTENTIDLGNVNQIVTGVPRPRLHLKSGASLSLQAGEYLYCHPRQNNGPFTHVEVGYIEDASAPDHWGDGYGDGPDASVFAYVPIEEVAFFIGSHGGVDVTKTYKRMVNSDD